MALTIDRKVQGDKVVVSRAAQADSTTPATLNKLMVWDEDSLIRQVRDAETNEKEKKGYVEATAVDVKGLTAEGTLKTAKATPNHIAWALRHTVGVTGAGVAAGGGFVHTFKQTAYGAQPSYFTAAHSKGASSGATAPADFQRFRGMAISQLELDAKKNEFLALNLSLVGLGYVDDCIVTIEDTVTFTAGSATLDFDTAVGGPWGDPEGATDTEKSLRIFAVCDANGDGHFETELTIGATGFNGTTNVLTMSSGSLSGALPVRITYERGAASDTWKTDVAAATDQDEYKLKATNMRLWLNRGITVPSGSIVAAGGQYGACEIDDFKWTWQNNAKAASCWATSATPDDAGFAQQVETGDFVQRLTLNRGVRDWMLKQSRDLDEGFGVEIWSVGPEYETGHRFEVHIFFPYCKILDTKHGVNEGKWREEVELAILQDPGVAAGGLQAGQYTVGATVKNEVSTYV